MKQFSVIAAVDSKGGIGKDNHLPWHLKHDLAHFNKITRGTGLSAVIMGRRTWESLPATSRPLPERMNIVLTNSEKPAISEDVLVAHSLDEALEKARALENIFVIGGQRVFDEAVKHPACAGLYLTHVKGDFGCDTFFPKIPTTFTQTACSEIIEENGVSFWFEVLARS